MKYIVSWIVCLWFLAACNSAAPTPVDVNAVQTQAAQTVIARMVTPTLAMPATLACDPRPFLSSTQETMDRFDDIGKRAAASPRISLSPVIGEMQALRRTYKNSVAPDCAERLHQLVLGAMQADIDTYLSFMAQDSDSTVQGKMRVASDAWKNVVGEIKQVGYLLGTPRPPDAGGNAGATDAAPDTSQYVTQVQQIADSYQKSMTALDEFVKDYNADNAVIQNDAWRQRMADLAKQFSDATNKVHALNVPSPMATAHQDFLIVADAFDAVGKKLQTCIALQSGAYLLEASKDAANPNARLPVVLDKIKVLK